MTQAAPRPRPHTGRRRNEEVRRAILAAALRLLGEARDGVPSVEAMTEYARLQVSPPDTGDVARDVEAFLVATFRSGRDPAVAGALRAVMAEAQRDPEATEVLRRYTAERRAALQAVFERGQLQGELAASADVTLLVDQAFGLIWYRLLVGHAPLTRTAAAALAKHLVLQARL